MQPLRLLHSVSIIFLLIIFSQSSFAQSGNVGIGTTTPQARLHVADSAVLFSGPAILPENPSDPPVSGGGNRMMWYPQKAAFRVGFAEIDEWDRDSIGKYSVVIGFRSKAIDEASVSMGAYNRSDGYASVSMGSSTHANGDFSTSMGAGTIASGANSTSMGAGSVAIGNSSTSMGEYTEAKGFACLAVGMYNDPIMASSAFSPVSTSPMFIVGNGDGDLIRKNAMVVFKSGNTSISGFTKLGSDAPAIKVKKYTTTSSSIVGGTVQFAHGLNAAKILSVNAVLAYFSADDLIPPSYLDAAGFEYNVSITGGNVFIRNKAGNSSQILNKQVRVTITYEE